MLRGLYASASALMAHALRHELASANVANLNTVGYKSRRPAFADFQRMLLQRLPGPGSSVGVVGSGPATAEVTNDLAQGALRQTGRDLDFALQGPGFFVVRGPSGESYTRAGEFRRDGEGRLVTAGGYPVLGEGGELQLPEGPVSVTADGRLFSGDEQVGRLRIVDFDDAARLERSPAGRFAETEASGPPVAASGFRVRNGFLEEANVDAVAATVELMASQRAFQASQQAIRAQNETMGLAVRELARLPS